MLMRDASLKQRIPCVIRISILGAFFSGKKCTLYKGKYSIEFLVILNYPAIMNIFAVNQILCYNRVFAIMKTPV